MQDCNGPLIIAAELILLGSLSCEPFILRSSAKTLEHLSPDHRLHKIHGSITDHHRLFVDWVDADRYDMVQL